MMSKWKQQQQGCGSGVDGGGRRSSIRHAGRRVGGCGICGSGCSSDGGRCGSRRLPVRNI